MEITGIHHVTAITGNAKLNYDFYTNILGMHLVKKTINQDNSSSYHLFYADEIGRPGTGLTFFETTDAGPTSHGLNSVSRVFLRVPNNSALKYWQERFDLFDVHHNGIITQAGRKIIDFNDPEGQRLTLVSDETNTGIQGGVPWKFSKVPIDKGIIGIGPVKLTMKDPATTISILTKLLNFKQIGTYPSLLKDQKDILIYSTGEGGTGGEVHLEPRNDLPREEPGIGSVDHIAFRVKDENALRKWRNRLEEVRMPNSGLVDRLYFKSLYFREPNGILFELATDGPGFAIDEDIDYLGETLTLPSTYKNKRDEIEASLTYIETRRVLE